MYVCTKKVLSYTFLTLSISMRPDRCMYLCPKRYLSPGYPPAQSIHTHIHMYVYTNIVFAASVEVPTRIYICIHACIRIYMNAYKHINTYTRIHTYSNWRKSNTSIVPVRVTSHFLLAKYSNTIFSSGNTRTVVVKDFSDVYIVCIFINLYSVCMYVLRIYEHSTKKTM